MLIYQIKNILNDKSYIGRTKKTFAKILIRYRSECKKNINRPIIQAINKYGFNNFEFTIIENQINDYGELRKKEKYWIEKFDTFKNGYNCNLGEDGGQAQVLSYEERYGTERAKQIKLKISKAHMGLPSQHKGSSMSSKLRKKIANKIKQKWQNREYKEKMLNTRRSENYKNKFRGTNNPKAVKFKIENVSNHKIFLLNNIKGLKDFCLENKIKFYGLYKSFLANKRQPTQYANLIISYHNEK